MVIVSFLKILFSISGNKKNPKIIITGSLKNSQIKGPVNLVSPTPIKQKDFSKLLAKEMKKIAILPIPAFVVKLAIGRELAEALVLSSKRVLPSKLLKYGYEFKQEYLNDYIKEIIDHE